MRSLLFVPADSERKLVRAPQSDADALILDLEDSVVPANRPVARRQTRDFLAATGSVEFRRYVRINPLSSGVALDDLAAVVPGKPEYCCRNASPRICGRSIIIYRPWRRRRRCRRGISGSSPSPPKPQPRCSPSAAMAEYRRGSKPLPGGRKIWPRVSAATTAG